MTNVPRVLFSEKQVTNTRGKTMRRYIPMLAVAAVSLVAGACAGKLHVVAVASPPAPVVMQDEVVTMLPFVKLRAEDFVLSPNGELPAVSAPVEPQGCNLTERIDAAMELLDSAPISIGTKVYRYTERRAGSTVTFKDPEKTIALALMDEESCDLQKVTITKRGDKLLVSGEYDIEPVRRSNGIRWNNWATELSVSVPSGAAVLVMKYPYLQSERVARIAKNKAGKRVTVYDTKKTVVPIYYTPYSKELHVPALVRGGEQYLIALAARVYADLRERHVPSKSVPGTDVADVSALRPEYVTRLAPIEHMDLTEFLLDPAWTTERIHVVIGANRERVATYTCSKASACGLMQFTPGTYALMRKLYPAAGLIADFEDGARDQFNAMKAAVLLHDHNTAALIDSFGAGILEDSRLEEYLAAAYNTGVGRVIAVLSLAKKKGLADWTEAKGNRKQRLLAETKGYIAKLRFLRDEWQHKPLAKADNSAPAR